MSPLEWLRFALVGAVGFAVDGGLLLLLTSQGHGVFPSRLGSFGAAVTVTWVLNRGWTFSTSRPGHKGLEYLAYFSVQLIGAAINLGVFYFYLILFPAQHSAPLLPLFVGAVPALLFNFTASKYLVFSAEATTQNGIQR